MWTWGLRIGSFGKVLQKFFDNEREDYKKEIESLGTASRGTVLQVRFL